VDPAGWTGTELGARTDWIYPLGAGELASLVAMAKKMCAKIGGDPNALLKTTAADFDLGDFAPTLETIRAGLREGPGLALLRGVPVWDLAPLEVAALYWGIGRHLGRAISNNASGDMISHVADLQKDYANPNQRGYQTAASLEFHGDQCDIVGLLCVHNSKSGGESKVVSSVAVYNEVLKRRPDLLDVLTAPYCWSKNSEVDSGEQPWYESPVFNFLDGYLCTSLGSVHMERGHRLPGAPAMSERQREGIVFAEEMCEALFCPMDFKRGDIQFLNNSVVLHTRTAFEDWPEPERKRRLLRLWLAAPDMRPPTPYIQQWRNGVRVASTVDRIVLY
jgi:hypothetical protein